MATQRIAKGTETFGAAAAGDTFYIGEGAQGITGNVDYSGVNTSVLAEVSNLFTGQIGTASAPWQTAFSTHLLYAARGGDLYFESDAADTETTALIYHIGGGHLHYVNAGTVTRYEASNGQTTIGNGTTVTTGRFGGRAQANILDTGTGAAITTLDVFGNANVYSQRPHTTINALAGTLVLDADSAAGVNAHGTVNCYGGRVMIKDSGTITTLNAIGSIPDVSGLARVLTITNTTINMTLPGSQALLDAATNGLIVFTNTPTRIMSDGRQMI